jgi:hypothetical protein
LAVAFLIHSEGGGLRRCCYQEGGRRCLRLWPLLAA